VTGLDHSKDLGVDRDSIKMGFGERGLEVVD
jgi:hypothetical protein